ncbi:hypothetical protein [Streptomyces sp. NPDC005828]|uniref:hypothetical protein n=1 Tax=Streptomyces sp. NPDC005828 TaxID=3157071 RepID=UPI00340AA752
MPPRLDAGQIAGTYSDGKDGALILSPDGKATATRVDTFSYDSVDSIEPDTHECTGTGTGTRAYDPVDGPYSQQVDVSIESCPVAMDSWSVYGTREHPKLYVFIGDPDSWDLYTLRRNQPHVLAPDCVVAPTVAAVASCSDLEKPTLLRQAVQQRGLCRLPAPLHCARALVQSGRATGQGLQRFVRRLEIGKGRAGHHGVASPSDAMRLGSP